MAECLAGSRNGDYNMHKSENEMKQAAELVVYEWKQFCWASRGSEEWQTGTGRDEYEDNSLKEVFLLHARVLRDFLNRSRARLKPYEETDVLAEDFFDTADPWKKRPTLSYLLEKKTQLDRALAHLSYDRISYKERGDKNWEYESITSELEEAFKMFLKALPAKRKAWFTVTSELGN
jgi:hypothetical protein